MHGLLHDIGVAIIAATVLGVIAHWLRQPIILGYLIAGVVVGPQLGYGLVSDEGNIEVISEIGLILLLFVIGLEMKIGELKAAGRQLLVVGFGQFPLGVALGLLLFPLLGYHLAGGSREGLYLALVCGLSSTAIVVKLLYDKLELDTLPGRLTLGVLVIQDIYAIFILAFQPNFSEPHAGAVLHALLSTVALLAAGFALSNWALKHVFTSIAKAPEMVVAVSIGWCALVAGGAGALGLSMEMGALVAGLSISAFPYSLHVTAKTLPLRDFFLTLFFMSLGMKLTAPRWDMAGTVAVVVLFTIASRFLSVYPLLALGGAGRRSAFITSLNLSQISEFSLVIAALGVTYHHIGAATVAAIIYAMAITAVISSYAIRYNHRLFLLCDAALSRAGLGTRLHQRDDGVTCDHHPIALLGFHRGARSLIEELTANHPQLLERILVIDFNLEVLKELKGMGVAATFGDISSLDTLKHAHLDRAEVILSTIPDMLLKGTDNLGLVRACRAFAPQATIIATADVPEQAERLRQAGANGVLLPYTLVGEHLAGLLYERLML
jgi:Kef-type K+ transport system membrane component KefB